MPTRRALLLALLHASTLPSVRAGTDLEILQVPVRFHLVTGLKLFKGGQPLSGWVTPEEVQATVVPEVNRIWRQAGIEFVTDKVVRVASRQPWSRALLLERIAAAHRDEDGHADPHRVDWYKGLLDFSEESGRSVNVHFVPYLGETSQGVTIPDERRVLVGEWTDKPSRASQLPQRVQLAEEEPFRVGSLGRTLAHELGHILGLKHPSRNSQPGPGRLMGGGRPGYHLTEEEIATARNSALALRSRRD